MAAPRRPSASVRFELPPESNGASSSLAPPTRRERWRARWLRLRTFVRSELRLLSVRDETMLLHLARIADFDNRFRYYLRHNEIPRARRRACLVWVVIVALDWYRIVSDRLWAHDFIEAAGAGADLRNLTINYGALLPEIPSGIIMKTDAVVRWVECCFPTSLEQSYPDNSRYNYYGNFFDLGAHTLSLSPVPVLAFRAFRAFPAMSPPLSPPGSLPLMLAGETSHQAGGVRETTYILCTLLCLAITCASWHRKV